VIHRAIPCIKVFEIKVPIIISDRLLNESLDDFSLVKNFRTVEKIERFYLALGNFLN